MELKVLLHRIKIHDNSSEYYDENSTMKSWVIAESFEEAEKIIGIEAKKYGWEILNLISSEIMLVEKYKNNDPEKEHADIALKLGNSSLINTKPKRK